MSIEKDLAKYIEFGLKTGCFETLETKKVMDYLKLTSKEQVDVLKNSAKFKELKRLKNKVFTNERKLGFKNEAEFERWVNVAKTHKNWGFVKDKDALIKKYKNGDFGFKNFKNFYSWYETCEKECCYCGTKEADLIKIFRTHEADKKPLYSKKPGFSANLQIEKRNPNKPYHPSNCVLACALCNNAKSDVINDENFSNYFANAVKKFIKDVLKYGANANQMPCYDEIDAKLGTYKKDDKTIYMSLNI